MGKYTKDDKTCPHCGGEITAHQAGHPICWRGTYVSDDPDNPTIIDRMFPKEEVTQNQSAEDESKFTQS